MTIRITQKHLEEVARGWHSREFPSHGSTRPPGFDSLAPAVRGLWLARTRHVLMAHNAIVRRIHRSKSSRPSLRRGEQIHFG